MEYADLQRMCARFGFTECPVTETGFNELAALGYDLETLYEVACDIASGIEWPEAVRANQTA